MTQNTSTSIAEVENKTLGRESMADARRFEVSYYTEKIPTDKQEILNLKKDRDTASLGLGRMYEAYFQNTPLATQTLYDLVDQKPEDEVKLQALYLIFSMNFERNPEVAERAKKLILQDFPYTPYAEFVKNPRRANFTQSDDGVKEVYQKAYQLFVEEKFNDAQQIISEAIEKYPKDALMPKFELLNAFIAGKTAGKEIMILQLQQVVFNYEKTAEGKRAREILAYLKSDLEEKKTPSENDSQSKKEENVIVSPQKPKEKSLEEDELDGWEESLKPTN